MDLKMKPTNEVLLKILHKEFMKDLRAAKLCASDTLVWVLKSEESIENYFHKWLINEGYAE